MFLPIKKATIIFSVFSNRYQSKSKNHYLFWFDFRIFRFLNISLNGTKKYHIRMSDRNANPIVVESALSGIAFAIEYEYDKRIRTAEKANGSIAYTAHPASC